MSPPRVVAAAPLAWHPRDEAPPASPPVSVEEDLVSKQHRREAKLLAEASRALDPWERYRALVDAVEEGFDIAEMADRKVRFALVVMAGLNVGLFALTSRPELLGLARQGHRLALVNQDEYVALGRLYGGLRVLALMFGGLVVVVGLSTLYGGLRP